MTDGDAASIPIALFNFFRSVPPSDNSKVDR
jgi:hypothetical protein